MYLFFQMVAGKLKDLFLFSKVFIPLWLAVFLLFARVETQDLGGASYDYFVDSNFLSIGSVITVVFDDDFSVNFNTETLKSNPPSAQLAEVLQSYFSFLPIAPNAEGTPPTKRLSVDLNDETDGAIGATIVAFDPVSQVYTITANRRFAYNNSELSQLAFTATVNLQDVSQERTVSSSRLAGFQVQYRDTTQNIQLAADDFAKLLTPPPQVAINTPTTQLEAETNGASPPETPPAIDEAIPSTATSYDPPADETVASAPERQTQPPAVSTSPETELTDVRKRQIMLQYINYLLRQWF